MISSAEFRCTRSRRRRSAPPQAARSGTPYGRAAWAPVPSAVPVGRPRVRSPLSLMLSSSAATPRAAVAGPGRRAQGRRLTPSGRPTGGLRPSDGSPAHQITEALTTASGGGSLTRGWLARGRVRRAGQWLRWKPGHPLRRRPRTSRADQALPAKVVLPVGSSTITGRACPAPLRAGRRRRG
jgi:hypothetical protein